MRRFLSGCGLMQLAGPVICRRGVKEVWQREAAARLRIRRDCAQLWFFLSRFPEEWDG